MNDETTNTLNSLIKKGLIVFDKENGYVLTDLGRRVSNTLPINQSFPSKAKH